MYSGMSFVDELQIDLQDGLGIPKDDLQEAPKTTSKTPPKRPPRNLPETSQETTEMTSKATTLGTHTWHTCSRTAPILEIRRWLDTVATRLPSPPPDPLPW